MQVTGTFNVTLTAQEDEIAPVGRMLIYKEYLGEIKGLGSGQMMSKRTSEGTATYSAIEEFTGEIQNKEGSFTFIHQGFMSAEEQQLHITILTGSGTDDFTGIEGELTIIQKGEQHLYELNYTINN